MTLEEQLNKIAEVHNLTSLSIHYYRRQDGTFWIGSYVHAENGCGSCDNSSTLAVEAISKAIANLDTLRFPAGISILAPMGEAPGGEA